MPIHMEIEAKFAVPDEATYQKLMALPALGDYLLVPRGEQRITDRYVDSADRDLFRAGHACRRRSGDAGGAEVVSVKGLVSARGAVHRRSEHEIEVPADSAPGEWPEGPARDIVLRFANGKPLVELLTLRQHRVVRDVMRDGQRVAVLTLDRIEFGGGRTACELEIELAPPGTDQDLGALTKLLRPLALRPQPLSKFERAVALLNDGAKEPPHGAPRPRPRRSRPRLPAKGKRMGVRADDPVAEAGRKILRYHWDQTLAHEAGTIAGEDPEDLHDMRVATRRQRAAVRIVEPYCRKKAMKPVRDGLRALGGFLGEVRDLDVQLERAREHQAGLSPPEANAFQSLLEAWSRQREAARVRMVEYLGGQEHAGFKERYTLFLDTPGAGVRDDPGGGAPRATVVAHALPSELWSHYGAVCAFENVLPWASVESLHELRIRGKRLRYLLEFFREVLDRCIEKPIEAVVALQDHLGELQDHVVTIGLVGEFLAGPEAAANLEAAAAAGHYRDARKARIEELRRGLEGPWRRVTEPAFRSCLARAAAGI